MSVPIIEKQYNIDLNNLRKKIDYFKVKYDKLQELKKNMIECNSDYIDASNEKFDKYLFQGYGMCNTINNANIISNNDTSINTQDKCKQICNSKENCSGFTMYKPGTHVTDQHFYYNDNNPNNENRQCIGGSSCEGHGCPDNGACDTINQKCSSQGSCDKYVKCPSGYKCATQQIGDDTRPICRNFCQKIVYDNQCAWYSDEPVKEWGGSIVKKNDTNLYSNDNMCFKKIKPNMNMCPKDKPKCIKIDGDNGICGDNNLEELDSDILTLNNEIINSFVKLNADYKKYKTNPEMVKLSQEIETMNNSQEIEMKKQISLVQQKNNMKKHAYSKNTLLYSENKFSSYLILLLFIFLYCIYTYYNSGNINLLDYKIILSIFLYVLYIFYTSFYK
jgi:hypothetical protein